MKKYFILAIILISITGIILFGFIKTWREKEIIQPNIKVSASIISDGGYVDFSEVGIGESEKNYLLGLLNDKELLPESSVIIFHNFVGSPEELLLLKLYALDDLLEPALLGSQFNATDLLVKVKQTSIRKDKNTVLKTPANILEKYNLYKISKIKDEKNIVKDKIK